MAATEAVPAAPNEAGRRRHWPRRLGILGAAAAATGGAVAFLRHRSPSAAVPASSTGVPADPGVVRPDDRPDLIHAAGHRHRLRPPPYEPGTAGEDHPPAPELRHRDRGGRSTAFHTRRWT